jgi:hypothetical protein
MELIGITLRGELLQSVACATSLAAEVMKATAQLYGAVGYEPPWVGYVAFEEGTCVGVHVASSRRPRMTVLRLRTSHSLSTSPAAWRHEWPLHSSVSPSINCLP